MKALISALVFALFLPVAAEAQSCKVFFTVIESDPHLPGGEMAALSPAQQKWWGKKGAKRFSGICIDNNKAEYKIVWWKQLVGDNFVARNVADPRFDTTIHRMREVGSAYVKKVGASDSDKPLFFVDSDRKGTADALQKSVEFLARRSSDQQSSR